MIEFLIADSTPARSTERDVAASSGAVASSGADNGISGCSTGEGEANAEAKGGTLGVVASMPCQRQQLKSPQLSLHTYMYQWVRARPRAVSTVHV